MTKKEYFTVDAISQSIIRSASVHPRYAKGDLEKRTTPEMNLGSLVDSYLTTPDKVEEEFCTIDSSLLPTEKMKKVADRFWEIRQTSEGEDNEIVLQAAKEMDYQANWKPETITKKFWEECECYIGLLLRVGDRTLVSTEDDILAKELADECLQHKFTGRYFKYSKVLYQYPILWDANGIPMKILLDMLCVVEDRKILVPIDIKTYEGDDFIRNFYRMKYYYQSSIGTDAVISLRDKEYPDYTVGQFRFIALNTSRLNCPLKYFTNNNINKIAKYGGVLEYNGKRYIVEGWKKIAEDIMWHRSNNIWDCKRDIYEAGGKVVI
jgi:hypothetical protein